MNEQERLFETTPEAPQREVTPETPPVTIPALDLDLERLLDEGGLVRPDDE